MSKTSDTEPLDQTVGRGLLEEEMSPSSALAHLYRGEVHRMKFWRERLDQTTNWAVIIMAAILTWAFSSENNPHYVILFGGAAVAVFLFIEARRFRAYDIWRSRVRILQRNVFAYGLDPSIGVPNDHWREKLGEDYLTPTVKITMEEAIAHRLRRVYLPLFTILTAAWVIRVFAFSHQTWPGSADIGNIPGLLVTVVALGLYVLTVVVAYRPRIWHARDELRTKRLRRNGDG